jgi:hypothetical protein
MNRDNANRTKTPAEPGERVAVERNPGPGTLARPTAGDARNDERRLKKNREHLGVGEDHKTPEMKKGHRGTFP